jgi:DNA-binding transcriptional LysR family regulator
MTNLSGVDLNLLVVLDALLSERSVSRAAQRVGLSQPAMSNALSRLRKLLDDPVMVRAGQAMEPTPRATELALPVHQLLDDVRRTLSTPRIFDARTSSYRFRIETTDDVELCLLPQLVERLCAVAPGVDVVMTRMTRETPEALRAGRADLYVGAWSDVSAPFHRYLLHQEGFRCIARIGHPRIKSRLSLRAYAELGHVLCGPGDQPGSIIDARLADEGVGRRVVVRTPNVQAVPLIVARSNLVATLPRSLADLFAETLPLQVHRAPIESADYPVYMVWHPRTHEQAPHRWLRGMLMEAAAGATHW